MNLRCIYDIPRDCSTNIALDEVFFSKENFEEIFRFYRWTYPAYTIGYFQKFPETKNDNFSVIRRITGGLSVLHNTDLSFSLIVSDKLWPYIYDQEKTYKTIHENIRCSLEKINIFCDKTFVENSSSKNYSCVQTLYKDDLLLNGKKIVGSCQRRRGKKILVEGSIHLKMNAEESKIFAYEFFKNLSNFLKCNTINNNLTNDETDSAIKLCKEKYNTDKWNKLF
ncbi:lipoate--protein ligase family protein [Candidatus Ruminimicrobiellum ovillum]|uniref:lipoate--protein ligase family protein n=1 Tax=Candidatus Ruminimicrobiellum ovillum TaxID=1947927 RepID=UPI00355A393C